ncbi:ABC transporter substrate-binding protein [Aquibacillus saliphilus]|uniref:ABC transporter substrate-binding protein n=1 Tax=Aquibacillus saliphilus TaxID=1909422 RepID=UPI001CF0248A|nr:ABC transporter substrate-binding protein [Aquibacillus saliphilus]
MFKMKRVSIVFFVLVLFMVGCSSGEGNNTSSDGGGEAEGNGNDVIELSYWVPFSGSDGEFMEDMVSEFNKSQSDIKVEFMNNNWDDYYTKFKTALVSNTAPDVAVSHVSHLGELLPTDKLAPLDELASEAGLDWSDFSENQVNAIMKDGNHYAVPLDTHAVIMFYNKKYLGDAGLLNEDGSIKMEQGVEGFTEVLRTLKQELPSDVSPLVIGSNNVFTFWIWDALINQQGTNYIEDGQVNIDTPESKEAMNLMKTWLEEDLMPEDIGDNSYDIFKTQDAAITFSGVWATGNFETEESLDFAAVPFPQLYDQPAAWGDSHTLVVPNQDDKEKQIAAVKFADWLTENGHMWAEAGHVPAKTSVIESDVYQSMPYRSEYAAVMEDVKYMPQSDKLGAINDAILESLVKINYGQISVEDGIKEAQGKVEELLNK